ncbi:hypothetical protein SVIOM74S_02216 [Streptomyces violarus]
MTSFDTSPDRSLWRALLAVVFVMLATTGWTALKGQRETTPMQASRAAWEREDRRTPAACTSSPTPPG